MDTHNTETILTCYGWNEDFERKFSPFAAQDLLPARIIREGKEIWKAVSSSGTLLLTQTGSFRNLVDYGVQLTPVIGDWCAVRRISRTRGLIEAIVPRKTEIHRSVLHEDTTLHSTPVVTAANVDAAAIVLDICNDFNLRRIERLLTNITSDKILAAVILTKADLVKEPEAYGRRVEARCPGIPVYVVDSISHTGKEKLNSLLLPSKSIILLGKSGAGKSTFINMVMGNNAARTAEVRKQDGKGRHITTTRELYRTSTGSLLLDTPGIRTVGISGDTDSVLGSFSDNTEFASTCKYSDCTHRNDPGCSVREAVLDGLIEQERYLHFLTLLEEAENRKNIYQTRREKDKNFGKLRYEMRRADRGRR